MIYDELDRAVRIVVNYGSVYVSGAGCSLRLVRVIAQGNVCFRFVEYLRSDDGLSKLFASLPVEITSLSEKQLIDGVEEAWLAVEL